MKDRAALGLTPGSREILWGPVSGLFSDSLSAVPAVEVTYFGIVSSGTSRRQHRLIDLISEAASSDHAQIHYPAVGH
jgi:hypothetical protein